MKADRQFKNQNTDKMLQTLEDLEELEQLDREQLSEQHGGNKKEKQSAEVDGYLYLAADIL